MGVSGVFVTVPPNLQLTSPSSFMYVIKSRGAAGQKSAVPHSVRGRTLSSYTPPPAITLWG